MEDPVTTTMAEPANTASIDTGYTTEMAVDEAPAVASAAPPMSQPQPRVTSEGNQLHEDQNTPVQESVTTAPKSTTPPMSSAATQHDSLPSAMKSDLGRMGSLRSTHSANSEDVDMEDNDDDLDGSDNESVASTTTSNRPSAKKKKGQKFYCTDFPPCQLSFTRSEHLARHIRKHTGERPFQCHCSRRFSRLDNLRQHAQTVHVNEDIPGDSLAATGTRFQRQIRTDRVRPTNRSRTSSLTQGSPSRGHSRNVSTSSITSTTSSIGSPEDYRRRPMPLAMAASSGAGPGLSLDTRLQSPESPNAHYQQYYSQSPNGVMTPSSGYTPNAGSPRNSGLQSPISIIPRAMTWGGAVPRRRLSVPSAPLSYQLQSGQPSYPPPYMSPVLSSNGSTYSASGSVLASPTSSAFSDRGREYTEAEIRRRTWHPSSVSGLSGRPATSGLSYYRTPDSPRPVGPTQPAAAQAVRLPGIDSFDRVNAQQVAPARRPPSPMQLDEPYRPGSTTGSHKRRPSETQWDSMNQNLTRLDLAKATPPYGPSQWRQSIEGPLQKTPAFGSASQTNAPSQGSAMSTDVPSIEHHPSPSDEPMTPRKKKRQGWYVGPPPASQETSAVIAQHRTSPEDSSSSDGVPTPSTTSTGDYQPAIVHSNGFIESTPPGSNVEDSHKSYVHPPPQMPPYHARPTTPSRILQPTTFPQTPQTPQTPHTPRSAMNMDRLDALAAVASSADHGIRPHHT